MELWSWLGLSTSFRHWKSDVRHRACIVYPKNYHLSVLYEGGADALIWLNSGIGQEATSRFSGVVVLPLRDAVVVTWLVESGMR
jgi:hypothetical protein